MTLLDFTHFQALGIFHRGNFHSAQRVPVFVCHESHLIVIEISIEEPQARDLRPPYSGTESFAMGSLSLVAIQEKHFDVATNLDGCYYYRV